MSEPYPLAVDYAPMSLSDREKLAKVLYEWRGIMHAKGWTPHRHVGTYQHSLVCFGDIANAEAVE